MANEVTPAAGTPPAPAPGTAPAPAAPSITEFTAAAQGMPLADLDALLEGSPPGAQMTAEPAAAPAAQPAAPAKPDETPPATPDPEAAKAPEGEDDPAPEKLGRFRIQAQDFRHAEFLRLTAGRRKDGVVIEEPLSVSEAYAKVYGPPKAEQKPEAKDGDAPPKQDAAPASPHDTKLATATTELEALEASQNKAIEDGELRDVARIGREIARKEREIERLNEQKANEQRASEEKREQSEFDTFRQKESAAAAEVKKQFPQLGDKASPERAEFDAWLKIKQDDPDYAAMFASPRWPIMAARDFAADKGLKPAEATPPAAAPSASPSATPAVPPQASRTTAATVLTPGGQSPGTSFVPTRESFSRDVQQMPVDELDKLLG
jgi:hypothetical protein